MLKSVNMLIINEKLCKWSVFWTSHPIGELQTALMAKKTVSYVDKPYFETVSHKYMIYDNIPFLTRSTKKYVSSHTRSPLYLMLFEKF